MTNHKKLSVNVSFIPNISKPIKGFTDMLRNSNKQEALHFLDEALNKP